MSKISSTKPQGRVKTLDATVSDLMDAALQPCSVNLGENRAEINALFSVSQSNLYPDLSTRNIHPDNNYLQGSVRDPFTGVSNPSEVSKSSHQVYTGENVYQTASGEKVQSPRLHR